MFENKIYIPKEVLENFNTYNCHIIENGNIISFDKNSTCNDSSCVLSSFVIDSSNHYFYQEKDLSLTSDQFNSYISSCNYDNYTNFTSDVFYRNDIDSVLISFIILLLILIYLPYKIISRLFGRWFKL